MLSDRFEVSTSYYDLFIPPAFAVTRPDALLSSPTIQEFIRYSFVDAQSKLNKMPNL